MPTWEEILGREYATWEEPVLTVDTSLPVDTNLGLILAYLQVTPM